MGVVKRTGCDVDLPYCQCCEVQPVQRSRWTESLVDLSCRYAILESIWATILPMADRSNRRLNVEILWLHLIYWSSVWSLERFARHPDERNNQTKRTIKSHFKTNTDLTQKQDILIINILQRGTSTDICERVPKNCATRSSATEAPGVEVNC